MSTNTPEYARKLRKHSELDRAFWAVSIAVMVLDTPFDGLDMIVSTALVVGAVVIWWVGRGLEKDLDAMEREE